MLKNLYLMSGTDAFTKGGLDNVALTENAVCLEQSGGRYVLYGCFTSPEIRFPAFRQLTVSWNAETPKGTVVEAQARVLVDGEWTGWLTLGKWSPYIRRESLHQEAAKPAYVNGDTIYIPAGRASLAQLRIYLYTNDEQLTPLVRLLAASVRPVDWHWEDAEPYGRLLRLPAYSQQLRDPVFAGSMSTAVTLASMINRWGQDALPEELAWGMRDFALGDCFNYAFMTALAGGYGYQAYRAYLDPAAVWQQVKVGHSIGLRMHYAANNEDAARLGLPVLPGAFATGADQCMALRGFALENGQVYVRVNDSLAPTDRQAETRYPAKEFWAAYSGEAVIITGKHPGEDAGHPIRRRVGLRALEQLGCYLFQSTEGEDLPLPEDFEGTLACTVPDGVAHATTAHKAFHYLRRTSAGAVQLPPELLSEAGRLTVYAIDSSGGGLVGEVHTGN